MDVTEVRQLAAAIAPLLTPGTWTTQLEYYSQGAFLVSGDMSLFVTTQGGYGHKPGMVRISPMLPAGGSGYIPPENKSDGIYVGETRSPAVFAREITRRILEAQDYPAKVTRHREYIRQYEAAENKMNNLAQRLGDILGAPASENMVSAWPRGTWSASTDSVHLDIHLPETLALKIAKLIKEEM